MPCPLHIGERVANMVTDAHPRGACKANARKAASLSPGIWMPPCSRIFPGGALRDGRKTRWVEPQPERADVHGWKMIAHAFGPRRIRCRGATRGTGVRAGRDKAGRQSRMPAMANALNSEVIERNAGPVPCMSVHSPDLPRKAMVCVAPLVPWPPYDVAGSLFTPVSR
jgi:hypothetical protein